MSKALKMTSIKLTYPEIKGIDIRDIKSHSLRARGENALHLTWYKDKEIKKRSMAVRYIQGIHIRTIIFIS